MKVSGIEKGGIYTNKNGLMRKVLRFLTVGAYVEERLLATDCDVEYVECDVMGYPLGKPKKCWYVTFGKWAAEKVQPHITPELARAAYLATKVTPATGEYIDVDKNGLCACAIGALYIWREGDHDNDKAKEFGEQLLSEEYADLFTIGFDDGERGRAHSIYRRAGEIGKQAFEDGIKAWDAVKSLQGGQP